MFVLQVKSKLFFIQSKKMGQFVKIECDYQVICDVIAGAWGKKF